MPRAHRVASLLKRWLLGNHQVRLALSMWTTTWTNSRSASTVELRSIAVSATRGAADPRPAVGGATGRPTPALVSASDALAHRLPRPHQRPEAPARPLPLPLPRVARLERLGGIGRDCQQSAGAGTSRPNPEARRKEMMKETPENSREGSSPLNLYVTRCSSKESLLHRKVVKRTKQQGRTLARTASGHQADARRGFHLPEGCRVGKSK